MRAGTKGFSAAMVMAAVAAFSPGVGSVMPRIDPPRTNQPGERLTGGKPKRKKPARWSTNKFLPHVERNNNPARFKTPTRFHRADGLSAPNL